MKTCSPKKHFETSISEDTALLVYFNGEAGLTLNKLIDSTSNVKEKNVP